MDLAPGTLLKLQRATSSAASPEGSYLGLCVHGVLYCIEIQLHDGPGGPVKGLLMPPFEPAPLASQKGEVLLFDSQFLITDFWTREMRTREGGSFQASIFKAVKQADSDGSHPRCA
jgi:hypothetical protein